MVDAKKRRIHTCNLISIEIRINHHRNEYWINNVGSTFYNDEYEYIYYWQFIVNQFYDFVS